MPSDQRGVWMTEWMKVMLEEIARKRAEAEAARQEYERRQRRPISSEEIQEEQTDPGVSDDPDSGR